jgi:catechol 2,3-dioxygenase-like lactoylglutathione lyase family enzyme
MLDHIGIAVSDLKRAHGFYDRALAPLGLTRVMDFSTPDGQGTTGYGDTRPFFWVAAGGGPAQGHPHIAFAAASRALVDEFYRAALAAGGRDNGAPGLRPHYHANYYGAFVLDPDGHNVEAVCHLPA